MFAFAPFIGALGAFALGERSASTLLLLGGALMVVGVLVHLAEDHRHEQTHEAMDHEHAHSHPHAPDLHHRHSH